MSPWVIARPAAGIFFPQSRKLGLCPGETHSPAVLRKIVQAGVRNKSFAEGSRELLESAELTIGAKTIERAVRRVGQERTDDRTAAVKAWEALPLPEKQRGCPQPKAPSLAVVQFDCGRLLVRERERKRSKKPVPVDHNLPPIVASKDAEARLLELTADVAINLAAAEFFQAAAVAEDTQEDAATSPPPSVDESRSRYWRDSKVGCLMTMHSVEHVEDPCPQIPPSFVDPKRISQLVREFGGHAPPTADDSAAESHVKDAERAGRPHPLVKTLIASRACSAVFGGILAAAAWARGFAVAPRKAFVADGAAMNWTLWERFFSSYVPILDFIHALQYVFAAAHAGRAVSQGWEIYGRWIQAIWSGQVEQVIAELAARQNELGLAPKDASATDPRVVVATTLRYLQSHRARMDYPRYRRLGLPIMSSYAESTVKQINYRVKGTEKFWGEAGAEAVLQLRADYLSDTHPLDRFWQQRQQKITGHRCYRHAK
jgi:hypothetical protein